MIVAVRSPADLATTSIGRLSPDGVQREINFLESEIQLLSTQKMPTRHKGNATVYTSCDGPTVPVSAVGKRPADEPRRPDTDPMMIILVLEMVVVLRCP